MSRIAAATLMLALCAPLAGHAGEPVDINTADAETLASVIDGIGAAKAQAIIDYRQANGPFKSVDDLVAVKGIGERTVERNRERLSVGAPASSPP